MDFDFLSFLHCFARAEKVELLRWAKSWVDWFLLPLWKVFWLKVMCSRQNTFGNTGSNSISSLKTLGRWCCRVFAQVHIVDPIDSVGAISPSTLLLVLHSTFLFSITLKAKTILESPNEMKETNTFLKIMSNKSSSHNMLHWKLQIFHQWVKKLGSGKSKNSKVA